MLTSCISLFRTKIRGNGDLVTEHIPAGDYTAIRVEGQSGITIRYVQSDAAPEVTVTVDRNIFLMYECTVKNSELIIKPQEEYRQARFVPTQFEVTAHSGALHKVNLAGNHTFVADLSVHGNELKLNAVGDSHIRLNDSVHVDRLDVTIVGGGTVTTPLLEGKTLGVNITGSGDVNPGGRMETASIHITGSGEVHGFGLQVDELKSEIAGSGTIEVYVNNRIDAGFIGSGKVTYRGNPQHIHHHATGGGKVIKVEL
ncbi:MAG: DUF2807 domain-containing protein [Tannerella sp.]|jgi:hypothetical protein|nr:DUF2807 domain-containing protein [Tannerella sp.]